jgi:hypothetical protein
LRRHWIEDDPTQQVDFLMDATAHGQATTALPERQEFEKLKISSGLNGIIS